MNPKNLYRLLVLIGSLGLVLSIIIFPFYKPLSLMYFYNQEYEKAYSRYQQLYDANDRSTSTIGPLILINLQYANIGEALRLMEEYMKNNPLSIDGWEYLGKLYLGADRPQSYVWTLETIYQLKPSALILRDLINYYSFYTDSERLFQAYILLVKNYHPDTWECTSLATLYATRTEYEQALKTLDRGLQIGSSSKAMAYAAEVKTSLLLDLNQNESAFEFVKTFFKKNPDPEIVQNLTSYFRDHQQPDAVLMLIDSLPMNVRENPLVVSNKVTALYMKGDQETVYEYLKNLMLDNKLPKDQLQNILSIGMSQEKNPIFFEQVFKNQSFSTLTVMDYLLLLRKASQDRLPLLQEKLRLEIPPQLLSDNQLLRYTFDITTKENFGPDDLSFYSYPPRDRLAVDEQVMLAIVYDDVGLKSLAKDVLKNITHYNKIPVFLLVPFASLLDQNDLEQEGLRQFEEMLKIKRHAPLEALLAKNILLIANDKLEEVNLFLDNSKNDLNDDQYALLFESAYNHKEHALALKIASILMEKNPSYNNRFLMAQALILNDEIDQGISILETLFHQQPSNEKVHITYMLSLAKGSITNPIYIERYHNELRDLIEDTTLIETRRREIAYALVDLGLKEEASQLFFQLAQDRPFEHPDTEMLRYVWGESLTPQQLTWVEKRAAISSSKEKLKWLGYLIETKNGESAYKLIVKEDLSTEEGSDLYIQLLADLHHNEEMQTYLETILRRDFNVKHLRKLGFIAFDGNVKEGAELIYLRILELVENDKEALKTLGQIYYERAAFCYARWYLGTYICLYEGDYLSYFYMAEIYARDQRYVQANPFYYASLDAIYQISPMTLDLEKQKALIFYRLNDFRIAIRLFEDLFQRYPDDLSLRLDFASILMDLNCLNWAYDLLFNLPIAKAEPEEKQQLKKLQTLWYLKSLWIEEAYASALELKEEDLYSSLAVIDLVEDFWLLSLDEWETALSYKPENEDYVRVEKSIIDQHRSFNLIEGEYRKTGKTQKEHFIRFGSAWQNTLSSRFGFLIEQDRISVGDFTNVTNGEAILTRRATRERGEAYWLYAYPFGFTTLSQIFFAKHAIGVGAEAKQVFINSYIRGAIEYNRPYWGYPETVIDYGTRDRAFIETSYKVQPLMNIIANIGLNRYYLGPIKGGVADSVTWQGFYTYELSAFNYFKQCVLGKDSNVIFEYSVDAEYPTWLASRPGIDEICFNPLLIVNREVHTGQFFFTKEVYRHLKMAANFGYAIDRYGLINKGDYVYGALIEWDKRPGLNMRLFYDHSPSTTNTAQNVDRFVLNLTYFY